MALDIIGAGFGRTGTLSLKNALEQLGFNKCYHMMEVMNHPDHNGLWRAAGRGEAVDWEALFAGQCRLAVVQFLARADASVSSRQGDSFAA